MSFIDIKHSKIKPKIALDIWFIYPISMGERKKMKVQLQSKSKILQEIIKKIDQILQKVPENDYTGNPIEDSSEFGRYQADLKKVFYSTEDGDHYSFIDHDFAARLIHDELVNRK